MTFAYKKHDADFVSHLPLNVSDAFSLVNQDDYLPALVITRRSTIVGNTSKYTDSLEELRCGKLLCSDYHSNHRKILMKCVSLCHGKTQVKFSCFCCRGKFSCRRNQDVSKSFRKKALTFRLCLFFLFFISSY